MDLDTVPFGHPMDAADGARHGTRRFDKIRGFDPSSSQAPERFDEVKCRPASGCSGRYCSEKNSTNKSM